MKVAIVYESKTGNTKYIADAIRESCKDEEIILFQSVEEALGNNDQNQDIDIYFLGSWTDKGSCGNLMVEYCNSLESENVAIFGTAGFGGSIEYYETLAHKFSEALSNTNKVLGSFYCIGQLPISTKNRYLSLLEKDPADKRLISSLENYHLSQGHPNSEDLLNAKLFAKRILEKL